MKAFEEVLQVLAPDVVLTLGWGLNAWEGDC